VGKNKLQKFAENETFDLLFQPSLEEVWQKDFHMKGRWNTDFFKNSNPIVLELGCGKGEYTINLAKMNPHVNYIGVDIKGERTNSKNLPRTRPLTCCSNPRWRRCGRRIST